MNHDDEQQTAEPPARRASKEQKTGTERILIQQHSFTGLLWFGGWLFTIGYLHLPFWRGVLALVLWPYYVGAAFGGGGP